MFRKNTNCLFFVCIFLTSIFAESNKGKGKWNIFKDSNKVGLKQKEKILIPPKFDSIMVINAKFAIVYEGKLCGLYQLEQKITVPCIYDSMIVVNDSLLQCQTKGRWGLTNFQHNILLEAKYKKIYLNGYGNAIVEPFQKITIVSNGVRTDLEADSVKPCGDGLAICLNNYVETKTLPRMSFHPTTMTPITPIATSTKEITRIQYGKEGISLPQHCDTLFKNLFDESYTHDDSLFIYRNGMKFGLCNISPDILTAPDFDEIEPLNRRYLRFRMGGQYGILNRNGQIVTDTLFDCLEAVPSHQYCKVSLEGKSGLIGYNGKCIIPTWFDQFHKSKSENILTFKLKDKYLAIIDTNGTQLLDTNYQYQEIGPFVNGFARVKKFGKYGFINRRGGLTIATQYFKVSNHVVEERASVLIKGKWALVDSWEKMLAQPHYDFIGDFKDSTAIAIKDGRYLLLDYFGKELCNPKFDFIQKHPSNKNYFISKSGGKVGVIRKDGNELIFTKYDQILQICPPYVAVSRYGKEGIVNINGNELEPLEFDSVKVSLLGNGYILVKKVPRNILKF